MAKNNETTSKFKVDISELKSAMVEARKAAAYANSEFKATSSTMDDWTKSSDGISAKLKALNTDLKSQETILEEYEKTLEEVKKEYGENSKEAREYATKLNNQKAVVNGVKKEISNLEDTLGEVSQAEKTAAKTGQDVSKVLDDMRNEAEDAGDGFTTLKGTLATFAGNMLTSFVGAVKDGISSLMTLSEDTREYRTELGKLETASTQAGASTDYIKEKWQDLGSVLGDEGAVAEGLNNLLAAGFTTEKEMDAITSHLEGAAIKWKDTLKFEGLSDGLQETLATGSAVGSFGEMLERSGINLDVFNAGLAECTTEADKQNYVLEQLSGLGLSELSKSYREQNKDLIAANKANSEYTDTLASIGETLEPVVTSAKKGFNELLQEMLKLVGDVDMEAFTSKIEEGFKVVKDDVLPAVKEGFQWILDNKDALIAGLAGIAGGFLAFKAVGLITGIVSALGTMVSVVKGGTVAWQALNLAMKMNIIGIIISAIIGLIALFVTLWNTSDDFRNFWINLWENIKNGVSTAVKGIGKFFTETIPNFFSGLIDWIKANWQTILVFLTNPFAGLFKYFYENNGKFKEFVDNAVKHIKQLPSKVWTWLVNTITKVTTWRKNMNNKAKEAALGFVNKVIEYIKQLAGKVWTWLVAVVTKVVAWRNNMINKAKEAALGFINKVIEYVKQLPSKMQSWLLKVVTNVQNWGKNLATKGKEAAKRLYDAVVDKVSEIVSKIKEVGTNIVTGLWNGINDKFTWLTNQLKSFAGNVTDKLKDFFGIHSPSRVMRDQVGKNLALGVADGIKKNKEYAKKSAEEMGQLILDAATAKLDKYKAYNDMTLADEVAYWNKIRKSLKKGTDARLQADKNYLSAKKDLNDQLKTLDTQYATDVAKVYEDLAADIETAMKKYDDAIADRAKSITSSLSLFKGFEADDLISKEDLKANLTEQVNALSEWNDTLTKLSKRKGVTDGFMTELESMGVGSVDTLKQLNAMSDKELAEYISLYNQKNAIAKDRAKKENKDLEAAVQAEVATLTKNAEDKIKELQKTYTSSLKELGAGVKESSNGIGVNIVQGIKDGLKSESKDLLKTVSDLMTNLVKTAKKKLKIKSPSRVFAKEIGRWIPDGIALGIDNNAKSALNSVRSLAMQTVGAARDGLRTAPGGVSGVTGGSGGTVNNFYQTINSPKQLSRLDIYRQSKNLLGYAGGGA